MGEGGCYEIYCLHIFQYCIDILKKKKRLGVQNVLKFQFDVKPKLQLALQKTSNILLLSPLPLFLKLQSCWLKLDDALKSFDAFAYTFV